MEQIYTYTYTDYRMYLKDYIGYKKSLNVHFSLKMFADLTGFKARDYILRVINSERNLSGSGACMLSQAMKLSEKEASYFESLVSFNQAKTIKEKDYHFKRLQEVQPFGRQRQLREEEYEYLSQWFHGVIRSLFPAIDFKDDFKMLGSFLDPPISESQARKSVELLLQLGILCRNSDGTYKVDSPSLSTVEEIKSIALAQLQKIMAELSSRSIELHTSTERAITGVTMSLSSFAFEKIKDEMMEFRKKNHRHCYSR